MTPAIVQDLPTDTVNKMRRLDPADRPDVVAALRAKGWTLRPIAEAFNISHESVRRMETSGDKSKAKVAAPDKPVRQAEPRDTTPKEIFVVPEEIAARMRELIPLATQNKGTTPVGDPRQVASEEYTKLLIEQYQRKVPRRGLEEATGQKWDALRRRLVQGGAMERPASYDKKYRRKTAAERRAEEEAQAAASDALQGKGKKKLKSA
ncbi:hypothetical protein GCM10025867_48030 (plasmid) [Frondihabitans sucicola]|uniref:Helix-turn-helix domain-containing protein n=1 Tax=Frondihabitans sucicola TaxID=1268041 RepID=A0ABN6Y8R9_9MICO|nr:hypothetical protein [Frondihabitans sucicola]BDZ52562.1 hypothetical protein GCM10025867_48030 [Frondihabitans sucicola]